MVRQSFTIICYFLIAATLGAQASGKVLNFHHLRLEDGLSESINSFVYEDSYGFVWISALDGVNRFDGVNVITYRPREDDPRGMKGKLVHSEFSESDEADIWFCTTTALNVYRRSKGKIEHLSFDTLFSQGLSLEYYGITLDEDHYYWFSINQRLFRYHIYNGHLQQLGQIDGLRSKVFAEKGSAKTMYTFSKDMGVGVSVYHYTEDGRWQSLGKILSTPPHNYLVHDQIRNPDGSFYFGCTEGLLYCNSDGSPIQLFDQFNGTNVKDIWALEQRDNVILLSSSDGILSFDLKKKAFTLRYQYFPGDQSSLGQRKINELHLSPTGTLWASMWTLGVDYAHLNKVKFDQFTPKATEVDIPESESVIFDPGDLLEDRLGNIWCTSRRHGLMVYSRSGKRLKSIDQDPKLKELLQGGGIHQIIQDRTGNIYLLPWRNWLIRYDPNTARFSKIDIQSAYHRNEGKLVELNDGRLLLTRYNQIGVMEVIKTADTLLVDTLKGNIATNQYYWNALFSRSGELLLTRSSGGMDVYRYQNQRFEMISSAEWTGETFALKEMPDRTVYLGGAYGLRSYHPGDKSISDLSSKWPSYLTNIYAIEPQGDSILWLSSNYGLLRFNISTGNINTYSTYDGLQSREFNINSSLTTRDGEMWFGSISGFNIFRPTNIRSKIPLAKVNLVEVQINDTATIKITDWSDTNAHALAYWENNLTFSFVASEYSDPRANQLRYRLEYANGTGYDPDWVTVSNQEGTVRYPQLPPGNYRFLVYGSNSDQVWTKQPKVIAFSIATPFWQTWWFYFTIALIIIGLIINYFRRRLEFKNLKIANQQAYIKQEQALQNERDRMAKDMHDELGGGLTTIRLLLKKVRRKNPSLKTAEELRRIDHHSSEIIKNMRFIVWALQRENEALDNFIAYLRHSIGSLLEDNELEHHWTIDEAIPHQILPGNCRKNLWLCVKEATHNVIKHAAAKTVCFQIEWDEQRGLSISVTDDGVGIPDLNSKAFGNGLENMRNRMKKIGGQTNIVSTSGTTVTFQLPTNKFSSSPKSTTND